MQLDAILEVAIGLVFVWLVISVATLEIQNRVGAWLNWRANHLEQSILNMLKDPALVEKFYEHPLVMEFMPKDAKGNPLKDKKGRNRRPQSIPAKKFAVAACEVIMNAGRGEARTPPDSMTMEDLTAGVKGLMEKNPNLGRINQYLLPGMERAAAGMEGMMEHYRKNTEDWFNDVMLQASLQYKLHAQKMAFGIGLVAALVLNIDTIQVAQKLWQEPILRAALAAQAQAAAQDESPSSAAAFAGEIDFPLGWTTTPLEGKSCGGIGVIDWQLAIRSAGTCHAVTGLPAFNNLWGWIVKITGYLLSAAAAAQGAPFWFDVLRKLVGIKPQPASSEK
jgi:hypothetical protein